MASVAALLLAVCLAAASAVPVLAQDDSGPASAGKSDVGDSPSAGKSGNTDFFGDDAPPAQPPSDSPSESPAQSSPPFGEQSGGTPPQVAVERAPTTVLEPAAIAAKLAIRDALDRKDAPAAQRLFDDALKRFPRDRDLREVHERRALQHHAEIARAIFGRASTDGSRLFGRQWQPGRTIEDGETGVELEITRGGTRAAAVNKALTQGYAFLDRGDAVRAEKVLSGAIRKHENNAQLHYALVLAHGLGGDFKKADEDSLRAVKLSREQPVALSQRASLMMTMGRREEAFAWATRALEGNSQDADALVIRGRVQWLDRKRPDLALVDLKKAAEINPERYQDVYQDRVRRFHRERALSSAFKGDFKQALADADTALEIDRADSQAHMARAVVYVKTGKIEETIKETTMALKSDPGSMWALFFRAQAMETLGAREKALTDLKRAAAIDPGRFRRHYEKLLRAKREGAPPIWVREGDNGVLADSR